MTLRKAAIPKKATTVHMPNTLIREGYYWHAQECTFDHRVCPVGKDEKARNVLDGTVIHPLIIPSSQSSTSPIASFSVLVQVVEGRHQVTRSEQLLEDEEDDFTNPTDKCIAFRLSQPPKKLHWYSSGVSSIHR